MIKLEMTRNFVMEAKGIYPTMRVTDKEIEECKTFAESTLKENQMVEVDFDCGMKALLTRYSDKAELDIFPIN